MKNIPSTLINTIKDDHLQDAFMNLSEPLIDTFFDEGILKEVPILGGIMGIARASRSIKDKLFLNNLMLFLFQLKDTTVENRRQQIEKIENNPKYKTKVGEKLLYIIDKCDDVEKSAYIGQLFRYFLEEKISYEDFLRSSKCIELAFLYDLKRFIIYKRDILDMEEGGDLLSTGLVTVEYPQNEQSWEKIGKGTLKVKVSRIGKLIQNLLGENEK